MVRRLREAGAIVVGLTPAAGDGDLRLHRVGDLRRDPQPLEPAAHPGRLERRLAPPRSPPAWSRSPRPATAPARSASRPPPAGSSASSRRAAASRWRPSSKAGTASPSTTASAAPCSTRRSGSTSSPAARRSRGAAAARAALRRVGADRRRASCASPGRPRAPRAAAPPTVSDDVKGAVADAAELLGSLGHEVDQRDPDWGGIGNNITPRFLRGVAEDRRRSPAPRAARTAHPRLRPARPAAPRRRSSSGRVGPRRPTPPASTRSSTPTTC